MSTTGQPDPDEHRDLRRFLKELPKVEAAPDFELRLRRRITSESPSPARVPGRIGIPAFAYSLLTLVVVTVVSYYMFFRQAEAPVVPLQAPPPAERTAPAAQPTPGPSDAGRTAETRKDAAPAIVPPVRADADKKQKPAVNAAPGPVLQERGLVNPAPAEQRLEKAKPASEELSVPAQQSEGVSAPAVAVPKSALKEQQQEANPQVRPEESPLKSILPALPPGFRSAAAPSQRSASFAAPELPDSSAHLDSLSRDSVRQKDQRRLQERLQKKKRPIE
jgi:hypothetical protein